MSKFNASQVKLMVILILSFLLTLFSVPVLSISSDNISPDIVPEELESWVPWVLKDTPEIQCPVLYNKNQHLCAYPGALTLSMEEKQGEFFQEWDVYAQSFVPLPGDIKNWPEGVSIDEQIHPVISRNGKPFVQLEKGRFSIKGDFNWSQKPKTLSIPDETGLISLSINNKPINFPDFRNGKLWLKTSLVTEHKNNHLDLHVFRKVTDTIPLKIETYIKLDVSGQQREIVLNGSLLNGFIASAVTSKLPVQIDRQGYLKIQVRPGRWSVNVSSYQPKEVNSITLADFKLPLLKNKGQNSEQLKLGWPKDEIWVLDQQPHLRRINVQSKISIDANQTQLPSQWKKYPAFQMKADEQMSFDIIKRGDPEPEPDQLNLSKKIWLDFDGKGFTINDKITGKLSRQWRLNASEEITLGQVTLNGEPQFITQDSAEALQGVEVRHGQLKLSADSRIESQERSFNRDLSSSGWNVDFNRVDATLFLPAGWKLFSLSGADASGTWIKKWTLLDLFLVLITSIAIFRLWGIRWGIVALLALVLTWHHYDAPRFIWINLIITVALLRALPSEGRIYQMIKNYRFAVLIVLVIMILPFIVNQARTALYPQLEFHNEEIQSFSHSNELDVMYESPESLPAAVQSMPNKVRGAASDYVSQSYQLKSSSKSGRIRSPIEMKTIDPNAMIQTGPGLPSWTLNQYAIRWDGPVRSDQQISMTFISPAVNSTLNVLRIVLVLLLALRIMDVSFLVKRGNLFKQSNPASGNAFTFLASSLLTGFLLVLLTLVPQNSEASFPSKELLNELQAELSKPTKCLPQCADIESMNIDLTTQALTLELRVHAQSDVSIPLPVPLKQWMPNRILIDGESTTSVFRKEPQKNNSQLWLFLKKGSHLVEIIGRVEHINQLQISLPLKPHHIRLDVDGWSSEGMDQDVTKISALSFLKHRNEQSLPSGVKNSDIEQSDIPVFAEMTRTLNLGLSWQVNTSIRGVWGSSYPVILKIPLMAGESVLSDNVKVENNHAIITLKHKNSSVQWLSRLAVSNQIKLKSIESERIIEKWILNASPIWHIEHSGIPVVYHQNPASQALWQPRWQPWPGEEVLIDVTRPKGVEGKTITIDSSVLTITPGELNTASNLEFNLRSSLGGQHVIHLPENAVLQTVSINNKNMPIRNAKEGLSIPILPGKQAIKVAWHESRGMDSFFHTSEVNLGTDSVNSKITLNPGSKRWILLTNGPAMGPAVLFWGVFGIILIMSYGLGRVKGTPLNTLQWILLWIGLSASEPLSAIAIVACIFALKARNTMDVKATKEVLFNAFQVLLVFLVIVSVAALIASIEQGLLGSPRMQISGNGSSSYQLNWFSDRIGEVLPQASMISVPVYIYRLIMLVWSIWLAFAVIKWAQWGWMAFSHEEYWKSLPKKIKFQKKSGRTQAKVPVKNKKQNKDDLFIDEDDISV
ncbi:MAG: hypothetical protein OQL19_13355 [Gammaproteobacteria bacterium]|nr:hypothetical protein [Gammaproteobacteria bacterium]